MAIGDYINHHNRAPMPFIWTAKATGIRKKSSAPASHWIIGILHERKHRTFQQSLIQTGLSSHFEV